MLTEICAELRNWFVVPNGVHIQTYTISGGSIAPLDFLQEGQYFRIIGSVFNDGLHQYPATDLVDEEFSGAIWELAIPPAVVDLADEIGKWQEKNGEAASSPFSSESFGGYSYSKSTDAEIGGAVTWQSAFKNQLSAWRKI